MSRLGLALRGLSHYRRSQWAVVAGVATAVSVLGGALVIGDSVRGSLRALALSRLGNVDRAVVARGFFDEDLAARLASAGEKAAPLLALEGALTEETSGRRAFKVAVYGVDARFFEAQGRPSPFSGAGSREAFLSEALARELAAAPGASLLLRIEAPAAVPGASLFGEREDLGRTLRASLAGVLTGGSGEFSLRPSQQAARAVFLPLRALQRVLKQDRRANTIVLTGLPEGSQPEPLLARLRAALSLADLGLSLRALPAARAVSLESASALLDDAVVEAARVIAARRGLRQQHLLTYLANQIGIGGKSVPYSLVTALESVAGRAIAPGQILLNDWAARDLEAKPGDLLTLRYFVWQESGLLRTDVVTLRVAGSVPIDAGDREMTPDYPGITESARVSDWDPPFPVDLKKVRPKDEAYWDRYKGTPKAFLSLEEGQRLFGHRLGKTSALRLFVPEGDLEATRAGLAEELARALDPARHGVSVLAARREALQASRGATDFDQYFFYFSFFVIVSALLLVGLFFRLGVEQRLFEIGLLRALGFTPAEVRRQFLIEGAAVAVVGALPGALGAAGFAAGVLAFLRSWGNDAVGTEQLTLFVTPQALALGAVAGVVFALGTVFVSLRRLSETAPRALLHGALDDTGGRPSRALPWAGAALLLIALGLAGAGALRRIDPVGGFFGAGFASLVALLLLSRRLFLGPAGEAAALSDLGALGRRSAAQRPGRSVLTAALIASATFLIVAIGAFRHDAHALSADPSSGSGGYAAIGESLLPIHHDPNVAEGREALNLTGPEAKVLGGVRVERMRLRPGEDASCLNLYVPRSPRILGAPIGFREAGRFGFGASLQSGSGNPWLLLDRAQSDGTLPAIGDQNSIQYVLKKKLGDVIEIDTPGLGRARLKLVAALRNSVFQSELIVGESDFLKLFPQESGYRVFLLDAPPEKADAASAFLEARLSDQGLDLQPSAERLQRFARVENTYLSTFQLLGALGLLLGTVGLATVILRNAVERRRELALLRAVGFEPRHLRRLLLSENAHLLAVGLSIGGLCAAVATLPEALSRGAAVPFGSILGLLAVVAALGLLVSVWAVRATTRGEIVPVLRNE